MGVGVCVYEGERWGGGGNGERVGVRGGTGFDELCILSNYSSAVPRSLYTTRRSRSTLHTFFSLARWQIGVKKIFEHVHRGF